MSESSTESDKSPAATPQDFDFLFGRWRIHNRRLDDPFGDLESWSQFEAQSEAYPILGRRGNVQHFDAPQFPGRPGFQGYALRLLDPEEQIWRIWWASTAGRGRLDPPVLGGFRDGVGQFDGKDDLKGREIDVRFLWTEITETSARWEQSFSFDDGKTFVPNWIMLHERVSSP
jgi:hypothetical protein